MTRLGTGSGASSHLEIENRTINRSAVVVQFGKQSSFLVIPSQPYRQGICFCAKTADSSRDNIALRNNNPHKNLDLHHYPQRPVSGELAGLYRRFGQPNDRVTRRYWGKPRPRALHRKMKGLEGFAMQRLILPAILFAAVAAAQTAPAPPAATTNQDQASAAANAPGSDLGGGVIISAALSKSLDARKNKVGDKLEAKTNVDLLSHGQIVLPRDTKIVGHVTGVKTRSKDSQDSEVAITFDHMHLKDGRELPIQVTVQAIGRPLQIFPRLRAGGGGSRDNGLRRTSWGWRQHGRAQRFRKHGRPSIPVSGGHPFGVSRYPLFAYSIRRHYRRPPWTNEPRRGGTEGDLSHQFRSGSHDQFEHAKRAS